MTTQVVHRPARRVRPPVPPEASELAAPPVLPDAKTGGSGLQSLLPMIGVVSSMTMMITLRNNPLIVAIGGVVLVVAGLGAIVLVFSQRGRATRTRRLHRERYLDYLEEQSERLALDETAARSAALACDPDPQTLTARAEDPARVWERRRADPDFLRLRLGSGTVRWRQLTVADSGTPTQPTDTFLLAEARRLTQRYESALGLPVTVPADRTGDVVIVGPDDQTVAVARALLAQLVVAHAPEDVALALAFGADATDEWAPALWAPHLVDDKIVDPPVAARRVAPDIAALGRLLTGELAGRAHLAAETRRTHASLDPAGLSQRLVVFSDSRHRAAEPMPLPDATLNPGHAGVTVVHLVSRLEHEPGDVSIRITVDADGAVVVEDLRDPDAPVVSEGLVDDVPSGLLDGLCRSLASRRLSLTDLAEQAQVGRVDTVTLLGSDGAGALDIAASWQPRSPRDFLRVPIGVDDSGAPLLLDLKESAELGMGPHGLCVGATGSGKSELLRSLVGSLAATHPPELLSMILVDYKGGAAFAPFESLPHVAGLIDNLADDPDLVDRAHASLNGEVIRRQQLLKDAGHVPSVAHYRMLRETRPDLPALPNLVVVIDEFGELITARDDFVDLFLTIGRIGRSIGVHLLLSSQRIEAGKLRGLDTYLSYRLGLRTFSESESSMVLDTSDAFHLPALPGYGWLKVDTSVYTRFRAAYASGPSVVAEAVVPIEHQRRVWRLPTYPGIHAANGIGEPDDAADRVRPTVRTVERTQLDDLITAVTDTEVDPARRVWLDPLPAALTLDQVCGRPAPTRDAGLRVGDVDPMTVPIGLLDDPGRQQQSAWTLDLTASGGHAAVIGGPQTGKTTLLRTVATSLALTHSPDQVAIYCIDFTGGGLGALRELPHVGGVAVRTDPDRLTRTVDELAAALAHREQVFRERHIDDIAQMRRLHAAGELPQLPTADIVLLIDGAGALRSDFDEIGDAVADLLSRGAAYGIHVVAAVSRWNELRIAVQPAFGTRIELRLNDASDSVVDRRRAATLPKDVPGRALVSAESTAQVALPRFDGIPDATSVSDALLTLGRAVEASWPGRRAPAVRVLPPSLDATELPDAVEVATAVPIGVAESTLEPVLFDVFGADQHLLVLGDSGCGKTNLLRGVADGLVRRYGKDDITIGLFDRRLSLTNLVPDAYLANHATSPTLASGLAASICADLAQRAHAQSLGQSWDGPRIVLVVDDYDVLTAGNQTPLAALTEFVPAARDLGLHVVLARPVAGAAAGMWDPFVAQLRDSGATALIMDGDRTEGALVPNVYATRQPVGRGLLVRRGRAAERMQTARFDDLG